MSERCYRMYCGRLRWHAGLCKRHWFKQVRATAAGASKAAIKDVLLAEQRQVCANPGCKEPLTNMSLAHLDHDHDCCGEGSACVACSRGVLCHRCNHMLGGARDDTERLRGAIEYLESFQKHAKPAAIVERDQRGYSLYNRRAPVTFGNREKLRDQLRPDGQRGGEWEYRTVRPVILEESA